MRSTLVLSVAWALTAGPDGGLANGMRDDEHESPRPALPVLAAAAPVEDGDDPPPRAPDSPHQERSDGDHHQERSAPASPESLRDKLTVSLVHAKSVLASLDTRLASPLREFARDVSPEMRMLILASFLLVVGAVVVVVSRMHSRRPHAVTEFGSRWTNRPRATGSSYTSL